MVKIKFCHHYLRALFTGTFSQKEIAMGILAIDYDFIMRADGKTKIIFTKHANKNIFKQSYLLFFHEAGIAGQDKHFFAEERIRHQKPYKDVL